MWRSLIRPRRLVLLAITLLVSVTCIRLGIWQWHRLQERRAYNEAASIVRTLSSMGEYLERHLSIRRSFTALMLSFFALSSLTYYFKDWAFSRGVLLITIAGAAAAMTAFRVICAFYDKSIGKEADRRIAIVKRCEPVNIIRCAAADSSQPPAAVGEARSLQ